MILNNEKIIDILWEVKENNLHPNKGYKKLMELNDIEQADINNKLSPIKNIVAILDNHPDLSPHDFLIKEMLPAVKSSINYLSNREIYDQ